MITLNLLPEVKLEYLRTRRIQARVISIAIIATIVAVGLVAVAASWVYIGQTVQKAYYTGEIKKNAATLKAIPDVDKYLTIQNQLSQLSSLHANKVDLSRLLDYLKKLNPAAPRNITLTSAELLTGDAGNTVTFQGEAKDYTGLNTFRDTLMNASIKTGDQSEKLFESVTVTASSLQAGSKGQAVVSFNISTTYNPNAFLASVKIQDLVVPTLNTTQSAQAAPDVFGKSSTGDPN